MHLNNVVGCILLVFYWVTVLFLCMRHTHNDILKKMIYKYPCFLYITYPNCFLGSFALHSIALSSVQSQALKRNLFDHVFKILFLLFNCQDACIRDSRRPIHGPISANCLAAPIFTSSSAFSASHM